MFLGHYGVALAAKRVAPELSLGTMFLAAQWLDLLWPVLVLLGIERVHVDPNATRMTPLDFAYYPWSHSLLLVCVWAVALASIAYWRKHALRTAVTVGLLVTSHWALDALVHRADLPLWLGGPKIGFGLWNMPPIAIGLELGTFAVGLWLFLKASDRQITRRWSVWTLIAFLLGIYAVNVLAPTPPPETPGIAIAAPALAMWLLVAWAYLADRRVSSRA